MDERLSEFHNNQKATSVWMGVAFFYYKGVAPFLFIKLLPFT